AIYPALLSKCSAHHPNLHSFPTRRSSDLSPRPSLPAYAVSPSPFFRSRESRLAVIRDCPRCAEAHSTAEERDHGDSGVGGRGERSEEHTSELQSLTNLVCRLLLEKKKHHA